MPFRYRLKKLLSTKKAGGSSRESSTSHSDTTAVADIDREPATEVHNDPETSLVMASFEPKADDDKMKSSAEKSRAESSTGDYRGRLATLDLAIDIVTILKEASETSTALNPVKTTCGILLKLLNAARETIVAGIHMKDLAILLEGHYRVVENERSELDRMGAQTTQDTNFISSLEAYLKALDAAREEIVDIKKHSHPSQLQTKLGLRAGDIKELELELERTFHGFMRQVHHSILQVTLKTSTQIEKAGLSNLLKKAVNARGDRVKPLTPGTRTSIIKRLRDWGELKDSQERVFWLHDEAGTGKSAIAAHMAYKWREEGVLGASFFFDRNAQRGLRNLERFCVTLAKELSDNHPLAYALYLESAPNTSELEEKSFTEVFRSLVTSVADRLSQRLPSPLIFIVDALDECDTDEVPLLINSIFNSLSNLPSVRFLLTSRPTMEIKAILDNLPNVGGEDVLLLDVKHGDTQRDHDIGIYVRHRLKAFSVVDQNIVIQCASGVFLWAFLACETLLRAVTPAKTLDRFQNNANNPTMQVLYEAALEASLPPDPSTHALNLLQNVLQGVGLTYSPVSIFAIQSFFPRNAQETVQGAEYVEYFIKKLGSIMKDGTPYLPIYILHPTFREFIEDQRSGARFYIAPPDGHNSIAIASLALLSNGLEQNVLGLDDGKTPLPITMPREFEPPARLSSDMEAPLRYAVAFWATHASLAINDGEALQLLINDFLRSKLLLWIEWSSAIKELSECIEGLRRLRWAIRVQSPYKLNTDVDTFCNDALRFVLRNSFIIEGCGLQAWMSALVFTPKHSLVYQTFSPRSLRPLPLLLTDHGDALDSSRVLLDSKRSILQAYFSPDAKRIFSYGTLPSSMRLWNTKSQKLISHMKDGHHQYISEAKFSSDGSLIVSGSEDGRVCLWDGYTGALKDQLVICEHSGISGLEFGLGNSVIVGVNENHNIWCWTIAKTEWPADRARPVKGVMHTDMICTTACSPDQKTLATFSSDMTIRLWDLESCMGMGEPMVGGGEFSSGSFSIDGKRIVAGQQGAIAVWDVETRTLIHSLNTNSKLDTMIAISPKGRIFASADTHIRLWDMETGQEVCPSTEDTVTCLEFDQSGTRLVSGSRKKHITLWTIRPNGSSLSMEGTTLKGHAGPASSVASSSSGRLVVSASAKDGTLRIWNTDLLEETGMSDRTHDTVTRMAVSNDGTRLMSAGEKGTFQLWDFPTGQKVQAFQSDQGEVTQILFSSKKELWASAHSGGNVSVWDLTEEHKLPCDQGSIRCMAFSHDDTMLVTGGFKKTVLVWELAGRSCVAKYDCLKLPGQVSISYDGKYLVSAASEFSLQLWDMNSHQLVDGPKLIDKSNDGYVLFSPDKRTILAQQRDSFQLFDTHDNMRCYAYFQQPNHAETIPSEWRPQFSSDGNYLHYWKYTFKVTIGDRHRISPSTSLDLPPLPISPGPLAMNKRLGRIYSVYWKEPILLVPSDVHVNAWVTHGDLLAFGSSDGRVFIIRFPKESIGN